MGCGIAGPGKVSGS